MQSFRELLLSLYDSSNPRPAAKQKPAFCAFPIAGRGQILVHQVSDHLWLASAGDQTAAFHVNWEHTASLSPRRLLPAGILGFRLAAAVFEAIFSMFPQIEEIRLTGSGWDSQKGELLKRGLTSKIQGDEMRVASKALFALRDLWMPGRSSKAADRAGENDGQPSRPSKPQGPVYQRFIPWLGGVLSFDVASFQDLPVLHRWMNDPRVAEFWKEDGAFSDHFLYLETVRRDPHMIPLICRFEEQAFGYFEIYWAKEDVIGPHCDAGDFDRGFHVLIGDERYRGKAWLTAWMTSILHLMFLDEPRTQKVVGEPQSDHKKQIGNLLRSGFEHVKTVDFPNKRAAILSLSRARFFNNGLWMPASRTPEETAP